MIIFLDNSDDRSLVKFLINSPLKRSYIITWIKVKLYTMWLADRVFEVEIPGALPVNVVRIIDIKRFVFCLMMKEYDIV